MMNKSLDLKKERTLKDKALIACILGLQIDTKSTNVQDKAFLSIVLMCLSSSSYSLLIAYNPLGSLDMTLSYFLFFIFSKFDLCVWMMSSG